MKTTLTLKERLAANHFLEHGNKSAAYRHAYSTSNMKTETVNRRATDVFSRERVNSYVESAMAEAANKAIINATWVLEKAALIAGFSLGKFIVLEKGKIFYDFSKATDDDWYCIGELVIDTGRANTRGLYPANSVKIKTLDKLKALDTVGRHVSVQAFKERIALAGVVTTVPMSMEQYKKARAEMLKEDDC
jgi:phage terminase small subunit